MKFFNIIVSGTDHGGEGSIDDCVATLAGYTDFSIHQLAQQFLCTLEDERNVYNKHDSDNDDHWCYRTQHAEDFVEWLIASKGFIKITVENKFFSVIWPHEEPEKRMHRIGNADLPVSAIEHLSRTEEFIRAGNTFSTLEPPDQNESMAP